jgi:hypothetical protein
MLQLITQVPALQVALPFIGGVQSASMQHALFAMQAPLQSLKPALHVLPQLTPSQVAVAFAGGGGHAVQLAPQLFTLALLTHAPLHR